MQNLLGHVQVVLNPIAEGVARRGAEVKFAYGDPPVSYSFLAPDPQARFGFVEQRVRLREAELSGPPNGRANLLLALNAINYYGRGMRCLYGEERLRFRRETFLDEGAEPIRRSELETHLQLLCDAWADVFQPLRRVQDGLPWHTALSFLLSPVETTAEDRLEEVERELSDLRLERHGGRLEVWTNTSDEDSRVSLTWRQDLEASVLVRPWSPDPDEARAIKQNESAPTVEALLEELNRKNHSRPYSLAWDPKRGVLARAYVSGEHRDEPPSRERILDCLLFLRQARSSETFQTI